jgi:hypothetical protein
MVNDLEVLLRSNVESPPPDHLDLGAVVTAGRRRVRARRRRTLLVCCAGVAVAAVGAVAALHPPLGIDDLGVASTPPAPDAPTLHLSDARPAVEGDDYRVIASYTNSDLSSANGRYFDGVTTDGRILYRDGTRLALMDPRSKDRHWLPPRPHARQESRPLSLGTDRLVLQTFGPPSSSGGGGLTFSVKLNVDVFDRRTDRWTEMTWPSLPDVGGPRPAFGPDRRLYVLVPISTGQPPPGGWPTDASGEADDSNAAGDTFELWSVSLTDSTDVRDEGLRAGDVAFTGTSMVWTDSSNGAPGQVHVRDLATGAEHSFDPRLGDRCNLLSFGVAGDRVVMGEYCGTYGDGVRDDRVQVVGLDGRQVVTFQDSGIDGGPAGTDGTNELVSIVAQGRNRPGAYVYDLGTEQFLRLDDGVSQYSLGGPTPGGQLLWNSPVNHGLGATQWLGQIGS